MKQNRSAVTWLFSFLRAVGLAALFGSVLTLENQVK